MSKFYATLIYNINLERCYFLATVCKTFALCYQSVVLSMPVCDVGVLWPNGRTDQDETWHVSALATLLDGDPAPPPQRDTALNFRPISVTAKWLHGSRWYLAWR